MSSIKPKEYKEDVRGQYEDFPYPFRDPNDEAKYFHGGDTHSLMGLSHGGWGGKRDLRQGARILIAGCGTGDSAVMFAEEMNGYSGEIVAIDLSSKSIEIAQARMKKRQLNNVTFRHMSILDLPQAGLGQFDIIESGGVLHHLPDPVAGLAALTPLLKPDGMMAIMVYGQYGRMAIYLVQQLMQQLVPPDAPRDLKIQIAREFLGNVPMGHWLTTNNHHLMEDFHWPDGSGIYDLFLHSTDRAYTVPQIYDWVEGCGLQLTDIFSPSMDNRFYLPEQYNASPLLRGIFAAKSLREQRTIAELMNGNMSKHYFYAAKEPKNSAVFAEDMVIDYGATQHLCMEFMTPLLQALERAALGERVQVPVMPMEGAPPLFLTKTRFVSTLLSLIDGTRSIGATIATVAASSGVAPDAVRADLTLMLSEMRCRQMVFLRHESIPPYLNGKQIMARLHALR
ncbi:MAG: class I SAM-dependent methyltransferase [Rickettsiales bacterium]